MFTDWDTNYIENVDPFFHEELSVKAEATHYWQLDESSNYARYWSPEQQILKSFQKGHLAGIQGVQTSFIYSIIRSTKRFQAFI